jgi:superfamily II DNA/RNA helicase
MEKFNKNKVYVLVCTDIAARGLDINGISHIYNYDIPKISKDYIHRIGRTARAGKDGIAINILSEMDYDNFGNVLKDPSLNIKKAETPEIETVRMMLPNQRFQKRQRWDSDDWKSRKFNREHHARNREWTGEGQRGEKQKRDDQGNFMGSKRNFRNRSGRGRIPQRSGNYRSQGRRQGNRARSFSRRGRF